MNLPDDPAELFGAEACADLRALKRAYARLVKRHGPETDPEAFRHVQERYERVRTRLEAGPAPGDEAAAPPPESPGRSPEEWVRWLQAGEEPPTVAALRAELAEARPHDVAAPLVAFGLDAGLDPTLTRPRLLELLARPELVPQAFGMCRMAFALDPRLLDEDWHRLGAEVRRLAPGPPFDIARVDALLAAGRVLDAWKEWAEAGPGLLAELPDVAAGRLYELFKRAAWVLPEAELERARERFQEVGLPLPEPLRDALDQLAVTVAALRRAEADPAVPSAVTRAFRRILGADGPVGDPGILMIIRDLLHARPALPEELARLDTRHPVLSATILRQVGRISGRYAAIDGKRAPAPPILGELRALNVAARDRRPPPPPRPSPFFDGRVLVGLATYLAVSCGAVGSLLFLPGLSPLVVLAAVWALLHAARTWSEVQHEPPPAPLPDAAAASAVRQELSRLAARTGAWLHELVAVAGDAGLDALRHELDTLSADPWADARLLGGEHVRRAMFPAPEPT